MVGVVVAVRTGFPSISSGGSAKCAKSQLRDDVQRLEKDFPGLSQTLLMILGLGKSRTQVKEVMLVSQLFAIPNIHTHFGHNRSHCG